MRGPRASRLAMGWEHMDGVDDVLEGQAVLHREDAFMDHVGRQRGQNMHPEDLVALRLPDDLHEATSVLDEDRLRDLLQQDCVALASDLPVRVSLAVGSTNSS